MVDVANSSSAVTAIAAVVAASLVWWSRVRRLTGLRNNISRINALSEEVVAANTAEDAEKLAAKGLGEPLGVDRVSVILKEQADGAAAEAVSSGKPVDDAARKTVYLPMISGGSPAGAFAISWTGEKRPFQIDEMAALQHLANQIAIALELHDRRFQREQVLRSEKLGAAGRLISAVAAEMAEPLARIAGLAVRGTDQEQAGAILESVASAKETLNRLLALGQGSVAELKPFDAAAVAAGLVEFRRRTWEMRSLAVTESLSEKPIPVVGARGAFEHALLDLLVHAEHAAEAAGRSMSITTRRDAGEGMIEIKHPAAGEEETAPLLDSVAGMATTMGGQARVVALPEETAWLISLPLLEEGMIASSPAARTGAPLTLVVIDPDAAGLRMLVERLAQRGHRVVPAAGGGEAADMAAAVPFDAILAAPALPDMDWTELLERTREAGCRLVLLCDSLAPLSHPLVQSGEALALRKPAGDADLDRVLFSVGPRE